MPVLMTPDEQKLALSENPVYSAGCGNRLPAPGAGDPTRARRQSLRRGLVPPLLRASFTSSPPEWFSGSILPTAIAEINAIRHIRVERQEDE
jgi:hypothetical protein